MSVVMMDFEMQNSNNDMQNTMMDVDFQNSNNGILKSSKADPVVSVKDSDQDVEFCEEIEEEDKPPSQAQILGEFASGKAVTDEMLQMAKEIIAQNLVDRKLFAIEEAVTTGKGDVNAIQAGEVPFPRGVNSENDITRKKPIEIVGICCDRVKKHQDGTCQPCCYHTKEKGCDKGDSCDFCHICSKEDVRKFKKDQQTRSKEKKLAEKQAREKENSANAHLGKTINAQIQSTTNGIPATANVEVVQKKNNEFVVRQDNNILIVNGVEGQSLNEVLQILVQQGHIKFTPDAPAVAPQNLSPGFATANSMAQNLAQDFTRRHQPHRQESSISCNTSYQHPVSNFSSPPVMSPMQQFDNQQQFHNHHPPSPITGGHNSPYHGNGAGGVGTPLAYQHQQFTPETRDPFYHQGNSQFVHSHVSWLESQARGHYAPKVGGVSAAANSRMGYQNFGQYH